MNANEVKNVAIEMVKNIGTSVLNTLYPNDFEYYMLSLELTYFNNFDQEKTIRYFSFPVMPNSITQSEPQLNNIKRNYGGLTVLNSPTFVPKEITIQGNFGKQMRVMLGDLIYTFTSYLFEGSTIAEQMNNKKMLFNKGFSKDNRKSSVEKEFLGGFVKSGYGSTKILQAMCEQSHMIDFGKPRRLYLYNPAIGEGYLVKVVDFTVNQSMQNNMIWNYTLKLKAIAPLESMYDPSSFSLSKSVTSAAMLSLMKVTGNIVKNSLAK